MTTILCINKRSRSGDVDLAEFERRLAELGPVITHEMCEDEPLEQVVEKHADQLQRLVIGGGDGTLNRALPAVLEAQVPMGVLPLGTANDFARSMHLPSDPQEALDVIAGGHTSKVSVGTVNDHPFLNAAGIGLGPELTQRLDYEAKQRLGVLAYLSSLFEVVGKLGRRRAEIVVDGVRYRRRFMQITVANGIHYGGGLTISEDAKMNDGFLNILCLEPQSTLELLGKFVTLRWGSMRGKQDKMSLFRGREAEISTRRPADVTADGEMLTRTPLHCRCRQSAIEVFVAPDT